MATETAVALYFHHGMTSASSTTGALRSRLGLPAKPLPDLLRQHVLQPVFQVGIHMAQVSLDRAHMA